MPVPTILVVDDTPEVLDLTSSVLEETGYVVLRCAGSREALAVLQDGHAVDLLLTDIGMPHMDGFTLAREARASRPSLPVAYLTGYEHLPPNGPAGHVSGPMLRKPCSRADLTRQVDELLAPQEDARLVQAVALEMVERHTDALCRAKEAEGIDRAKGDKLSAQAWHDIGAAIRLLQQRRS
jgi:CheY-like chemotaxis protein